MRVVEFGRILYLQLAVFRPILAFSPATIWILSRNRHIVTMQPSGLLVQVSQAAAQLVAAFLAFMGLRRHLDGIGLPAET